MTSLGSVTRSGVRLRPVSVIDSEFIVQLRTKLARSPFLEPGDGCAGRQAVWIRRQQRRQWDFYFIIENVDRRPLGTIGFYHVFRGVGQWGRWAVLPGTMAPMVSLFLMFDIAFGALGVSALVSHTSAENARGIHLKRSLGHREIGRGELPARIAARVPIGGVLHLADGEKWSALRSRLEPLVERLDPSAR